MQTKEFPGILPLRGTVQHYDWGGFDFIPGLLRESNPGKHSYAELWIGDHPNGPARAEAGGELVSLSQLISADSAAFLGAETAARYGGRLPYLLKVLDARKMLSIQAHPTLSQAAAGFARENHAGIDLKAPQRTYKDPNHKPEIHVALTDFWLLHGFRPLAEIGAILAAIPEWESLMPDFGPRLAQLDAGAREHASQSEGATTTDSSAMRSRQALLRQLYQTCMDLPQARVDALLDPMLARLAKIPLTDKDQPDFWALRAAQQFPLPGGHRDRGIFSIYFLNLIHLRPGEGTFQPAGILHAYLEGVNVELMANSDNVLRGGLTPKHVDAVELLRTLEFSSGKPQILQAEALSGTESIYPSPADEFQLSRIELSTAQPHASELNHSADSLIVLEGEVVARAGRQSLGLTRGDIFLARYGVDYTLAARSPAAVLFKASVPGSNAASRRR